MAKSLFLTEKVVLSILLVFFLSFHTALSQITPRASITYNFRDTSLESVFEYLAGTSGYNFIYSSTRIDIARPVTLTIKGQSIEEVLVLIGKQANVSFRIQDRHVIVKAAPQTVVVKPDAVVKPPSTSDNHRPSLRSIDSPLITSVSKGIPPRSIISNTSVLQSKLDRRISELQALLGPSVPRNIPPIYINRINYNNRSHGWFASIGAYMNDRSTGLEFQAGLRYLYAVVQPRWSVERGVYGVYGLGNSFRLMRDFSFNTMYMFSGYTTNERVYPYNSPALLAPEFQLTQTFRHHQVKLAMQYAMSNNVTFRFGPVLNYQTTLTDLYPVSVATSYETGFVYRHADSQAAVVYQNGQYFAKRSRTTLSWLGWEGSIAYRLNFSNHR
jgi:hypothetical protein